MEIKGKVYCFFEQSGTFKREFRALGIQAEDYDIQNDYGETDHVMDLFSEIDNAFDGKPSVFDTITNDDLIVAFYPCIYFCEASTLEMRMASKHYIKKSDVEKIEAIIERSRKRQEFYERLLRFVSVVLKKNLRMVFENPWQGQGYLFNNFLRRPDIIDKDRSLRGDWFHKPTAYWFWNCVPTNGYTPSQKHEVKIVENCKSGKKAGICSAERSMIAPEYARNFIRDFILGTGKGGGLQQAELFSGKETNNE